MSALPKVGIIFDNQMMLHRNNWPHVEQPNRISVIYSCVCKKSGWISIPSREATDKELSLCHNIPIIEQKIDLLANQLHNFGDCYANQYTKKVARLAAGCSIQLVEEILSKNIESGFAIVRPPGHHAHCMHMAGFCFYNNAMLAAIVASKTKRVMIVDFDVHYGDGTVQLMSDYPQYSNISYFSIHRYDCGKFYPGSGVPGRHLGGRVHCVGFDGSCDDEYFVDMFEEEFLKFAKEKQPELIVVSAGFDAADGDSVGGCAVTPRGYSEIIRIIQSFNRNIAMILEGGYHLGIIGDCAEACVVQLLKQQTDEISNT